jgi:NADP-dependent 3-hydroxy acid dehydrogenase YdfG
MSLSGKVAVVTGSSSGIGQATVTALLSKGVSVAGWSRNPNTIENSNYLFCKTDISNTESVAESFAKTRKLLGDIDILINNAGLGFVSEFEKLPDDQWHQMFDVNVHGLYYCTKIVIPDMKKKGSGYIVNVGSIAGTTAVKNMVGYAATKHAVTGISHSLFMELREYGIKVSCIYPGSVKTSFFDKIGSIEAHDNMMMPEDIAGSIIHLLGSSPNYHMVDIEMRPLKPKG